MKILISVCLLSCSLVSFAADYPTLSDLSGNWALKTAKCSGGKDIEALKDLDAVLKLDEKQLNLQMTDKNGKKEDLFSGKEIVLQEDLLSFFTKLGSATMKVQLKDKKTLVLRIPILGPAADCPSTSDLQVLSFTRSK